MDTSVERSFGLARIASAAIEGDDLALCLSDGRTLTVPLAWFPKLLNASPEERRRFRLIGKGVGIHWTKLDEDLSLAGLLCGPND